jgi:DNA-directed RNA polymerase specialized sigma24 family protein
MVIDFELQFKQLLIVQDEIAFNEFYLQTVDIFSRYLRANYFLSPEESEDILADFYVKCRNGLPKYDIDQNFSGYIWSIFKNNLKDFWKKKEDIPFSEI